MKYYLIFALSILPLASPSNESAPPSAAMISEHVDTLKEAIAKKENGLKDFYLIMETKAKAFEKDQDVAALSKALRYYSQVFQFDKNYFTVEIFASIYQNPKLKGKFLEALVSALSIEDRKIFLEQLNQAIKEETGGNG